MSKTQGSCQFQIISKIFVLFISYILIKTHQLYFMIISQWSVLFCSSDIQNRCIRPPTIKATKAQAFINKTKEERNKTIGLCRNYRFIFLQANTENNWSIQTLLRISMAWRYPVPTECYFFNGIYKKFVLRNLLVNSHLVR